jgi:hypothetical protein
MGVFNRGIIGCLQHNLTTRADQGANSPPRGAQNLTRRSARPYNRPGQAIPSGRRQCRGNMFELLFYSGFALLWTVAWGVGIILQLGCIVHVLKTGRPYYWIFVLFWFSYLGVAAYLFFEVKPTAGKFNLQSLLWRMKSADQRIAVRAQGVEFSGTIRNRLLLADELHAAGRHEQECQVLSEGLRGAFKDDAQLLMRLAEAQLEAGQVDAAIISTDAIVPERTSDFLMRLKLLRARILSLKGQPEEADGLFQELIALRRSEAPRYYYAQHLLANEQRMPGVRLLVDILHQYRRGTPVWRHQEQRWYRAAKRLLKSPQADVTTPALAKT